MRLDGDRRHWRAAVPLIVILLAGCGSSASPAPTTKVGTASLSTQSETPSTVDPEVDTLPVKGRAASPALAALDALPVKGRAPKTGYSREQFGQAWTDVNRNGCDTRTDILGATLTGITRRVRCTIMSGILSDPYTGRSITYIRGGTSEVDIDHVVALSNAWQTGAFAFPFAKRVALANDPVNLLAVDASTNRQKSDGDAATWLPPNKAFRCDYVARQITVKRKYELWVTAPEASAMKTILQSCPGQTLLGPGPQPTLASNTGGQPEPSASGAAKPATPGATAYYRTCANARAAGVTPLIKGTAVYAANTHLDRDKNGIACK